MHFLKVCCVLEMPWLRSSRPKSILLRLVFSAVIYHGLLYSKNIDGGYAKLLLLLFLRRTLQLLFIFFNFSSPPFQLAPLVNLVLSDLDFRMLRDRIRKNLFRCFVDETHYVDLRVVLR